MQALTSRLIYDKLHGLRLGYLMDYKRPSNIPTLRLQILTNDGIQRLHNRVRSGSENHVQTKLQFTIAP